MKIHVFIYKCKMFWWHGYAGRAREKKQFKCRVCDTDFAQKQAMKSHLFTVNNLHLDSRMFWYHGYAGINYVEKIDVVIIIRKSMRPRVLNANFATNVFFLKRALTKLRICERSSAVASGPSFILPYVTVLGVGRIFLLTSCSWQAVLFCLSLSFLMFYI